MTLKPCPFCGCFDVSIKTKDYGGVFPPIVVRCDGCGAQVTAKTLEDGVKKWNKRYFSNSKQK